MVQLNFKRNKDEENKESQEEYETFEKEQKELLIEANTKTTTNNPFTNNKEKETFDALFEDDEEDYPPTTTVNNEENKSFTPVKKPVTYGDGSILQQIETNIKELRKRYPMGGLRASRFITTEILMNAPQNYFEQYDDIIRETVANVQVTLSSQKKSGIIAEAQSDPTNEDLQDSAYRIVHSTAADFLDGKPYRSTERAIIMNFVCNEIVGFSRLDPLWRDPSIDEILCNGPYDIQVEIKGQLYKVPACRFRDKNHIMALIERLYGAINKTVSRTTPIVDGRLHDNSRMAVVHTSIAPDGPNFSIRRHKEEYISAETLIKWGAADEEIMTFLGNLLYKGCSMLIIGGTSTGKTTMLSALTGFLREDHRILTLEDNLELKIAPQKFKAAAMECLPERPDQPGSGVKMRDLVKASLRQRPNCVIVGEVRDDAAYDLCQALNTGHYGLSTIHANNEYAGIYRLVSLVSQGGLMQEEATLPLIAASFDFIIRIDRFPTDGSRKIVSISEVSPFPKRNEAGELYLPTTVVRRFVNEGLDEKFKVLGHWEKVNEVSQERRDFRRLDLEEDLSWEQLKAIAS